MTAPCYHSNTVMGCSPHDVVYGEEPDGFNSEFTNARAQPLDDDRLRLHPLRCAIMV